MSKGNKIVLLYFVGVLTLSVLTMVFLFTGVAK
jgi:hypothetical protein